MLIFALRGAPALCRSVFDPLPAEGRWAAVLALDGNIGIGGDPVAFLDRMRHLTMEEIQSRYREFRRIAFFEEI